MTDLHGPFADLLEFTPSAFKAFGAHIKDEWLIEAVSAGESEGKTAKARNRKLPPDRVIFTLIGMGLFADRSIHEVVTHLELSLPKPGPVGGVAASSVAEARQRLGSGPVENLFEITARHWAAPRPEDQWRGLSLHAADGFTLRVHDSAENSAEFSRPQGNSPSGYPQVRVLGFMSLRTHVLRSMVVGSYSEGELTLARRLWDRVPENSLTVLDRGFVCWGAIQALSEGGRNKHLVVKEKKGLSLKRVQRLGPGDELVEVRPSADARRKYPDLADSLVLRRISCRPKGFRPFFVLTTLLSADDFPASEFAALYRERWEIEVGYDELKTHLLERKETLRSKTPEGVRQELAGIGIAYNLVRVEMARLARDLKVSPLRVSFQHALHFIRGFCLSVWATSPGAVPRRLDSLDGALRLLVLPERRADRRYPREVKVMTTSYTRKNGGKSASNA